MDKINVTKSYLPPREKLYRYVDRIYESGQLTNNGDLVKKLESKLQEYLNVKHVILVANGTLALQISYNILGLKNYVITTPYSFVATTSSMVWAGLKPVFSDIDKKYLTLDPEIIDKNLIKKASAIVPVHVYGNPCNIEAFDDITKENTNIKILYDAAHAFGVKYKGKSLVKYGDVSILSFHATKLFQTIEGGAIVTDSDYIADLAIQARNFGIDINGNIISVGINAKMNEFEAAMGLCVLDDIKKIIADRKRTWSYYNELLDNFVEFPEIREKTEWNHSYVPILFRNEKECLKAVESLNRENIYPRRYFYPSLDTLSYINAKKINSISLDIASRVLCLPTFTSISNEVISKIANIIKKVVK